MSGLVPICPWAYSVMSALAAHVPLVRFRASRGGDHGEWAPLIELAAYLLAILVVGAIASIKDCLVMRRHAKGAAAEQRRLREARRIIAGRVR